MKLAILDADILRDDLIDRYESYGAMFGRLFAEVAPHWETRVFNVVAGDYPEADDFDAYLITGSKHDAFSPEPWIVTLREYCRARYRQGCKLIGICFGHQLLAHALGGKAERSDKGWGLGRMTYRLCETPDFVEGFGTVALLASHQDQVTVLPPKARRLLQSDFCTNAAYYIPGRVLGIQPHPEFSAEYLEDLMAGRKDRVAEDTLSRALASLTAPHDGERVARWMVRFCES